MSDFREMFTRWGRESPTGDEFWFFINGQDFKGRVEARADNELQLTVAESPTVEGATP